MAQENGQGSSAMITFMELALEQARLALDNLEVPVGCVIVKDGNVIASGNNHTSATRNATRHAEMEAIDSLLEKWQAMGYSQLLVAENFSRCDVYVTCEPCIMCATALSILGLPDLPIYRFSIYLRDAFSMTSDALQLGIREVFYGCANDKFGGCGSIVSLHVGASAKLSSGCSGVSKPRGFKCTGGIMAEEAIALFRCFYEQGNPNAPKPHRPVKMPQGS